MYDNGQLGAAGGRILGGDFAEVTRIFGVGLRCNGGFALLEEDIITGEILSVDYGIYGRIMVQVCTRTDANITSMELL